MTRSGSGAKKITSKKIAPWPRLFIKCFLNHICNVTIMAIPAKALTMKGTITLLENIRNRVSTRVYKMEDDAEAN
jgi:hypothetical protein